MQKMSFASHFLSLLKNKKKMQKAWKEFEDISLSVLNIFAPLGKILIR